MTDFEKPFIVETGWPMHRAIALYKKFGFHEKREYISERGIKKNKFSVNNRNKKNESTSPRRNLKLISLYR